MNNHFIEPNLQQQNLRNYTDSLNPETQRWSNQQIGDPGIERGEHPNKNYPPAVKKP